MIASIALISHCVALAALDTPAIPSDYVYLPIAPEIAHLGSIQLPNNSQVAISFKPAASSVTEKFVTKYLFSRLSASASLGLGFHSVGVSASASYDNAFVDFAHFYVEQDGTGLNTYFVAYGQGCRLKQTIKAGSLDLTVASSVAQLTASLTIFSAEFDTYGFTKAYPFQLQCDDKGLISPKDAMSALVQVYNTAVQDKDNTVDVPLGVWVPAAWSVAPVPAK